jgi:hypothetical protein
MTARPFPPHCEVGLERNPPPMYNITIGRFEQDPSAQGVIRPADESWQLVIDKDGFPHLYIQVKDEEGQTGMLCIEDMLIGDGEVTIPDLMKGHFGGKLSPEEEEAAHQEYMARKERTGIPCPR